MTNPAPPREYPFESFAWNDDPKNNDRWCDAAEAEYAYDALKAESDKFGEAHRILAEKRDRALERERILREALEAALHDFNMSDTEFSKGEWVNGPIRKIICEALAAVEKLK